MIVRNALCALPGRQELVKTDLAVSDDSGRIRELGLGIQPAAGEAVLDAEGLELYPGAIDPHVHFDEPGFTTREDFYHGSMAAARGGVTTVIDMPCTSQPPVTTLDNLKAKLEVISERSVVDFALYGGVSGHRVEQALATDMEALAPYVVGFKCYFVSGMDTFTAVDHYSFGLAARKAAELGRPLLLHSEDAGIVGPATKAVKERLQEDDREADWADYVASRPESAELVAAASALALARGREGTLHVVHVGTAEAAELLAAGGASAETCPHYLAFSMDDFADKGSSLKTAPPVKARGQAARLWKLLADGVISFVTSDHAPCTLAEKNTGSVWNDYGGIPGTGTLFPYLYSEGYKAGRLSLPAFLRATGAGAAQRYGLSGRKGSLEVGKDADFVLVDPAGNYVVNGAALLSKGTVTPFEGMSLRGSIKATFVRGRPVWLANSAPEAWHPAGSLADHAHKDTHAADGSIVAEPGYGNHILWGYR
ncbi:MAG: amidohydrolase family protein [Spirochaetia bacterium]|nr:amidohydrolase family protein [Spirochaetia bacterium]